MLKVINGSTGVGSEVKLRDYSEPLQNQRDISSYASRYISNFDFGIEPKKLANILKNKSYAEIKEFALSVYRQYILSELNSNAKAITERQIQLSQLSFQD